MARRAGKAASRRARQRKAQRPNIPARPPSVASPDAAAAAESTRAESVSAAPAPVSTVPRRGRASTFGTGGSSLTDMERSEYHYVERDLRNIGILTAAMIGLLIVAWLVFSATGHVA
jgi:hypothetical protein